MVLNRATVMFKSESKVGLPHNEKITQVGDSMGDFII
jgi:hypothetical protein